MINFEKATDIDAEILTEIQMKAFDYDVKICGDGPPGYDSQEHQIKAINKYIYYKIVYEDIIIGGFYIRNEGNGIYELVRIFINPLYQGRGIGKKALHHIENMFEDLREILLETPSFNIKNHAFYEGMGYVKIGEIKYGEDCFSYKYRKVLK
ncbi:GNAT family N-acetyltransferase [Clostridium sp. 19966]|uniref:GNAT family N-acetyltransferase n=1 Tax=Clostridium sp. 19966 TaxID=2768166 RepID=UPI0028DF8865|nr:GNAT family N-acetyltransferase [Clostridium sp. 19966]MDT8719749.1 GNAT family N-acetyltransferase [Clostridium sp. 19966]